ncbi:hypothetical protein NX059_004329 [Plenodomus lindquistii]|nr:hypothetical protein NX059_004329 [Plenodomus lindquistii]
MNILPLHLLPQYASPEMDGMPRTEFFPDKPHFNATGLAGRMKQTVAAMNEAYAYRTPFVAQVQDNYRDASFASFNVNRLMTDIYYNPVQYLNGTTPLVVERPHQVCDAPRINCTRSGSPDSFMWFDALHMSEQTSRVVAREFVKVMSGVSEYAEYWG